MKRDNFSQLPTSSEFQNIINSESQRNLPDGKEDLHYIDFLPLINLAEHFGINTSYLTKTYTKEAFILEGIFEKAKEFVEELKHKILTEEHTDENINFFNQAYDYLSEEDKPEKSDLIFVFGAKTPLRIEKAIELYKEGYSDKILVSGRSPHYTEGQSLSEAEKYSQIAIENGVPKDNIILEDESITIPDNVRASLNLLDKNNTDFNSIILINSPYTQRRGWAHFMKYSPEGIKIIRVNSRTGEEYQRDTWYKSEKGIEVVLSEYLKMLAAVSLNTA